MAAHGRWLKLPKFITNWSSFEKVSVPVETIIPWHMYMIWYIDNALNYQYVLECIDVWNDTKVNHEHVFDV